MLKKILAACKSCNTILTIVKDYESFKLTVNKEPGVTTIYYKGNLSLRKKKRTR